MSAPRPRRRASARNAERRVVALGLLAFLIALRIPWAEADVGSPGIWPFGAFSTDEGEYTGGGRLHHLTGRWLDPEMGYPSTLTYAPMMHLLSAASYALCGLSPLAARLPTALAAIAAWLLAYRLASRATAPWLAGLVTLLISSNPISLTYERWGSSDVVFSFGIVLAWCLLRGRSPSRAAAAGLATGFAVLTKSTAVLFAPFLFAEAVRHARHRTRSAAAFGLSLAAAGVAGHLWIRSCVQSAGNGGLSPVEFPQVQDLLTLDLSVILRSLAIFPRPTTSLLLGPFGIWCLLLPSWCLAIAWVRTGRLFAPRHMLLAALAGYVAVLSTQERNPSRYFLPLLYFTPWVLAVGRHALLRAARRPLALALLLALAGLVLGFLYWTTPGFPPNGGEYFRSNAHVVPRRVSWAVSWPVLLAGAAMFAAVAGWRLGWRGGPRHAFLLAALAVGATWIFTSGFGRMALGARIGFVSAQALIQFATLALLFLFLAGRTRIRWPTWYGSAAAFFLAASLLNPCWRLAYPALLQRTYETRFAAAQIQGRLPPDAIVIGRRASTLLQGTGLRLGLFTLCSASRNGAAPLVARIDELLGSAPGSAVYWLVAADEPALYVSPDLPEIASRFRMELVETVLVPGDRNPSLVLLFLVRLEKLPGGPPRRA